MKTTMRNLSYCLMILAILTISCQKEMVTEPTTDISTARKAQGSPGQLKQTKTYSSDVVQQWLAVQTAMLYNPAGKGASYGIGAGRFMAYSGVALYEAVVPGMPGYQSLSGQLNQMPEMPKTMPGYAYHWPTAANAALAQVSRRLFGVFYDASSGDQLENNLNMAYQAEISDPDVYQRSVAFGKEVANKVADWAASDRPWTSWTTWQFPAYAVGDWRVAAPPANGIAYWGETRNIVPGSITNVATPEMEYSEVIGSTYYSQMKEVYDVSKTLTLGQRLQAIYYDDPATLLPAGASYWGILKQVTQQINPPLDLAAHAYAKAGISLFDATIGSFKAKFTFLTERPVQYIRRVIEPSNDPATWWNPLIPTPGHPDHPSNHAVFSGSFAYALTSIFGDNVPFTNSIYAGVMKDMGGGFGVRDLGTRSYTSFYDMMNDISYSRLYGGIHTRYSCEEGMKQGMKTATNIHNSVKFLKE